MIRKKIAILLMGLLVLNGTFGKEIDMKNKDDVVVEYLARFHFNNMGCIYRVNGMDFKASYSVFNDSHDNITFMDYLGPLMNEGENSIEILAVQFPTYPKNGSISFCEVAITASAENKMTGESDSKEVIHLRVTLDGEGKFTTEQSRSYSMPNVTENPILRELDETTITGYDHLNRDVMATRHLKVNHPHRTFAWVTAQPFENTPENVSRVWAAYEEIIEAFKRKDERKLAQIFLPAAREADQFAGYIGKDSRRWKAILTLFKRTWDEHGYIPIPVNKDDYYLEIADHGKLFRLTYKGGVIASPIKYKLKNDDAGQMYNFYFTEINGKIRPAIL